MARALAADGTGAALDPYAARFLPSAVGDAASLLLSPNTPHLARNFGSLAASVMTGGLVDHITLRTQAIDREATLAGVRGVNQLVILGAGFDMRAWRLPHVPGTKVYEIDHPATQTEKRIRLGTLDAKSTFVAVDFEKTGFADALVAAGFDKSKPSTWIWEGVVPYLNQAAVEATLSAIAALAAQGSTVIITYVEPLRVFGPLQSTIRRGFSLLGEPLRFFQTPDQMANQLAAFGFTVQRDTDNATWASPGQQTTALRARAFNPERLVVGSWGRSWK